MGLAWPGNEHEWGHRPEVGTSRSRDGNGNVSGAWPSRGLYGTAVPRVLANHCSSASPSRGSSLCIGHDGRGRSRTLLGLEQGLSKDCVVVHYTMGVAVERQKIVREA
jgi:hypothetical protein